MNINNRDRRIQACFWRGISGWDTSPKSTSFSSDNNDLGDFLWHDEGGWDDDMYVEDEPRYECIESPADHEELLTLPGNGWVDITTNGWQILIVNTSNHVFTYSSDGMYSYDKHIAHSSLISGICTDGGSFYIGFTNGDIVQYDSCFTELGYIATGLTRFTNLYFAEGCVWTISTDSKLVSVDVMDNTIIEEDIPSTITHGLIVLPDNILTNMGKTNIVGLDRGDLFGEPIWTKNIGDIDNDPTTPTAAVVLDSANDRILYLANNGYVATATF